MIFLSDHCQRRSSAAIPSYEWECQARLQRTIQSKTLPALDQINAAAANNVDIETWISAGEELFTSENIFTYERPPVKNYITTSKSLYLNGRVEVGNADYPEVVSIRGRIHSWNFRSRKRDECRPRRSPLPANRPKSLSLDPSAGDIDAQTCHFKF